MTQPTTEQTSPASNNGPPLSILGVKAAHAKRAIRWMRDRNLLAFYRAEDSSLNAFEFKHGRVWTYGVMNRALDATR